MLAVKRDDLGHRPADRERAADDRAGAGPGDQVETQAEIECRFAANAGELVGQAGEKGARIDAAHAAAVEAEHPVGAHKLLIFLRCFHQCDPAWDTTSCLGHRIRP